MPFFSKVFKPKDATRKPLAPVANGTNSAQQQWSDSWLRTRVDPEEVAELLHECTVEIKSRGLDVPFLLLPFRPSSDPSAARTFVRNYFFPLPGRTKLRSTELATELRMTEVMVIISVMKWCWARLPGGIVSWDTYELFKRGEKESRFAKNAFSTLIPLSVDSKARAQIVGDFFDLLAALAAHGKSNGLGGHKLSRYAGWWAFEHYDTGKGFDAGYQSWTSAANATSHLFFAYLRSLTPDSGSGSGILGLPRSLQQLVDVTSYPPPTVLLSNDMTKVVMVVDVVSPTPYALLRRAKNFEYRDDDSALQQFANYDDPVDSLTNECRRVLKSISSANQSHVSNSQASTSLVDPSWSRFEDLGFDTTIDEQDEDSELHTRNIFGASQPLARSPRSTQIDLGRPTTPSWADFLSSGFVDENGNKAPSTVLLPPDKILPPINGVARGQSSQSHRRDLNAPSQIEPGELASIARLEIDDCFWWVWISSLAGEEPTSRKAVFGRCALIETVIQDGQWMIMEEQVKGAAPEPVDGAYIAEKKTFLGFSTKRRGLTRRKSAIKKGATPTSEGFGQDPFDRSNRTPVLPDQEARVKRAAAELSKKKRAEENAQNGVRRREDPTDGTKTDSIYTMGPLIKDEVSPALKWASQYDKKAIRAQYLGSTAVDSKELLTLPSNGLNGKGYANGSTSSLSVASKAVSDAPPPPPKNEPNGYSAVAEPVRTQELAQSTEVSLVRAETPTIPPSPVPAQTETQKPITRRAVPTTFSQILPIESIKTPATSNSVPEPRPEIKAPSPEPIQKQEHVPVPIKKQEPAPVPGSTPIGTPKMSNEPENVAAPRPAESAYSLPRMSESSGRPRKSSDVGSSDKRFKKGPPPSTSTGQRSGIKRIFGTLRSKSHDRQNVPPAPDSPTESDPAIAATRRALEGKPALPSDQTSSPPLSPNHFNKFKSVKTPMANVESSAEQPAIDASPALVNNVDPAAETTQESSWVQKQDVEPRAEGKMSKQAPRSVQEPLHAAPPLSPQTSVPLSESQSIPPTTRRDEEYDNLSRIHINERKVANKEFAKFDQGPLLDQPAFIPDDDSSIGEDQDPTKRQSPTMIRPRPLSQSIHDSVTMPKGNNPNEAQMSPITQTISPVDRWAQIRKNAAERAAKQAEDLTSRGPNEKRTDDGDTNGEETIETRVARIKARVAELTGNIDNTKR